jgi:RNA polymerase sigma-70 factor (ECF subfamily)
MPATRWSLLMEAFEGEPQQRRAALEEFCQSYWQPLYFYARRRGCSPEDAEDGVQSFLSQLVMRDYLDELRTQPHRGRLRAYLLTGLTHFLNKQWRRDTALKRGGADVIVSFDSAEAAYIAEPMDNASPDVMFERRWAISLFQHCLKRLRSEYVAVGKADLFDALKDTLGLTGAQTPVAGIAERTGMSEGAARVAAHRLRLHLRGIIESEVAQTVGREEDVQDEMRHLMQLLAHGQS